MVVALFAGGMALALASSRATSGAEVTVAQAVVQPVRAQEIKADANAVEQTYTGIVRARYETDLAFRVGAKIVSRHVEVGQRVKVGTVLYRLDPTDYQLAVTSAEADLRRPTRRCCKPRPRIAASPDSILRVP